MVIRIVVTEVHHLRSVEWQLPSLGPLFQIALIELKFVLTRSDAVV